ncbi:MAG: polyribonucleotide nucleotidyltransferase [Patescibacteria group bacterium]
MQKKTFSVTIGGQEMIAEFNDLANQTNGSVLMRSGNTVILATAVMGRADREGMDYFPLTVDYEERFYAAGEILGSRFMRREGRPSEDAILSGRVIDRTIRPLFDARLRRDVQVVITVLSLGETDPDILAVNAASLALLTSDIPWSGPVGAVRIIKKNDAWTINPSYKEREDADIELIVSGKDGKINMIEAGAKEVSDDDIVLGLTKAVEEIARIEEFQKKIGKEIGKEKITVSLPETPEEMKKTFADEFGSRIKNSVMSGIPGWEGMSPLKKEWETRAKELFPEGDAFAESIFEHEVNRILHEEAVERSARADGRALTEVRSLFAQAGGISPLIHGTGIFYRGGTHVFSALTLGGPRDALLLDGMEVQEGEKRFMHHYNFPPFSGGETGRMGGTNRRMIGHGALAERALSYVLPAKDDFPYTIRIVSESMASNGSTSMGAVCAGTLALMDAGIPITRPVAGIAMGLMMSLDYARDKRYAILTDIQGPEDHHGDMDLKVAGTERGITAIQLDIKIGSIPVAVLKEALGKAKEARLQILEAIREAIPEPRAELPASAPRILRMKIRDDQIGLVIGSSGKTINKIKKDTLVEEIEIEDDGTIYISGKNGSAENARQIITDMTREYKVGERFDGEVVQIFDFGALVKINTFTEGLVHISELAPFRIRSVREVVNIGDVIPVSVRETDEQGRIKFSLKDADPEYATRKGIQPSDQPTGGERRGYGR